MIINKFREKPYVAKTAHSPGVFQIINKSIRCAKTQPTLLTYGASIPQ